MRSKEKKIKNKNKRKIKIENKTRTHELCRVVSKPWAYACWMTFVRLGRRNRRQRIKEEDEEDGRRKWIKSCMQEEPPCGCCSSCTSFVFFLLSLFWCFRWWKEFSHHRKICVVLHVLAVYFLAFVPVNCPVETLQRARLSAREMSVLFTTLRHVWFHDRGPKM